jgi:hypothetical protein
MFKNKRLTPIMIRKCLKRFISKLKLDLDRLIGTDDKGKPKDYCDQCKQCRENKDQVIESVENLFKNILEKK